MQRTPEAQAVYATSTAAHAAHLLLSALAPLTERDDDADITLPAAALQGLLEDLVNELHGLYVGQMAAHQRTAREAQP